MSLPGFPTSPVNTCHRHLEFLRLLPPKVLHQDGHDFRNDILRATKAGMPMRRDDFESIVRTHQRMLYRIAYNFFRNSHVAEEIVQDTLLQLYRDGVPGSPAHLRSWLCRTATHRCIDLARRRRGQLEVQVEELPEIAEEPAETDPLLNERLRRLVASLPETQRLVVILRFGEDMSTEEIAAALEMPSPTVRSHLQRALSLLRAKAPQVLGGAFDGCVRKES